MPRLTGALRPATAATAFASAAIALTACGGGGAANTSASAMAANTKPTRILDAPKNSLSAAAPQPNGTIWVLAGGRKSRGLFEVDFSSGKVLGSVSVANTAQSVAETQTGIIALALGSDHAGALQLIDGYTAKTIKTVPLPAPAKQVAVGSDGATFYVLTAWATSASVAVVDAKTGTVHGTIPAPGNAVSVAPSLQQTSVYALQSDGHVAEISVADGEVMSEFAVGHSGRSVALSPDGTKLYVLKHPGSSPNIAVINTATESVSRTLTAPSHCREVLTSAGGAYLYEVVGTSRYGNIQVFSSSGPSGFTHR